MKNPQEASRGAKGWGDLAPWLALVVAVLLLVWPAVLYGEVWRANLAQAEEAKASFKTTLGTPKVIAESKHFQILTYENYVSPERARAFLEKAEIQRTRLMNFLSIPERDRAATVVLLPDCGISHSGSNYWMTIETCNNRSLPMQSTVVMHELTHALMTSMTTDTTSSFFSEGLAVMTGERYGWAMPKFSPASDMYYYLREGELIPVSELYGQVWSADKYQPGLTSQRYAESGSFTRYLTGTYGIALYLNAYQDNGNFETVYGKSLAQLEQDWVQTLRTGNLVQAVLFTLVGAGILVLVTLSILRDWRWIPAAATGWLACIAWDWYAYYPVLIVPGGLLISAVLGGLVAHWRRRLGLWLLWLGGVATLAGFMLASAVLVFFR